MLKTNHSTWTLHCQRQALFESKQINSMTPLQLWQHQIYHMKAPGRVVAQGLSFPCGFFVTAGGIAEDIMLPLLSHGLRHFQWFLNDLFRRVIIRLFLGPENQTSFLMIRCIDAHSPSCGASFHRIGMETWNTSEWLLLWMYMYICICTLTNLLSFSM